MPFAKPMETRSTGRPPAIPAAPKMGDRSLTGRWTTGLRPLAELPCRRRFASAGPTGFHPSCRLLRSCGPDARILSRARSLTDRTVRSNPRSAGCRRAGRLALLALAAAAGLLAGCAPVSFLITPVVAERDLQEYEVGRESIWASKKIALLEVDGVLRNARSSSLLGVEGENPVSLFKEKLDKAARDEQVRAVVLRINSPGGGVTASDMIYQEIRKFRADTGKPVVACMLDVAASGGYYIACAADRICAHPTTVTGSIGVIMIAPDISGTMSKIGARANIIKSGELKDAGSPFREMTERDRAVFQQMIDTMYERFVAVVAEGRPGVPAARIREMADGRVFLATTAREAGLIDEITDIDGAIRLARSDAGLADTPIVVVQFARPIAHRPNVYASTSAPPATQVNLINVDLPSWLDGTSPQFLYLWAPGW